jgi:hypothetical protein
MATMLYVSLLYSGCYQSIQRDSACKDSFKTQQESDTPMKLQARALQVRLFTAALS